MRSIVLILIICVCVCSGACSKRGIAYTFPSEADMAAVSNKISWWYNWASNPATAEQNYKSYGIEYVPMIWGSGALQNRIPSDSKYLLGFNEPNFVAQSNLPAATAASLWPQVETIGYAANPNIKILSPAVNYCGGSCVEVNPFVYLDNFFANCESRNCKVDYIAVHWYACTVEALKWYVDQFRKYNKKIWVTEISCAQWDGSWQDSQQFQIEYMKKAVAYLESEPLVIRYAWFSGRTSEIPYVNLFGADGQLTDLGNQYLNQPCQESPINPPPPPPPSSIPVSCSTKFNVDFWGSDISNKAVSSVLDCCAYCKSISNCAAWTLYNGVCYAKTSAALLSEQSSAGRISGSINQGSCGTVSDIDYNGSDISNTPASSTSSCCSYCGSIPNCQAWTLSNNVCYAKTLSALSNPIPTSGISSGIMNSCSTTNNIDYFGSDISQKSVSNPVECCAYCQTVSGCFAWTFNSNTKMCFAKAAASILNAITTSGAVGGVVNRCVWANDIDYFGSDISYKAVSSAAECCAYCQTVSNCAVWTLSEGYCYAKSSNALSNPQQKTGLISGKMTSSLKVSFLTEESNTQSSIPQQSLTLIITSVVSIFIVLIILGVILYKKYSQSTIISNETHHEVP